MVVLLTVKSNDLRKVAKVESGTEDRRRFATLRRRGRKLSELQGTAGTLQARERGYVHLDTYLCNYLVCYVLCFSSTSPSALGSQRMMIEYYLLR